MIFLFFCVSLLLSSSRSSSSDLVCKISNSNSDNQNVPLQCSWNLQYFLALIEFSDSIIMALLFTHDMYETSIPVVLDKNLIHFSTALILLVTTLIWTFGVYYSENFYVVRRMLKMNMMYTLWQSKKMIKKLVNNVLLLYSTVTCMSVTITNTSAQVERWMGRQLIEVVSLG